MNLLKRFSFLTLGLVVLSFLSIGKSAYAVSYYGLSCTSLAYGSQIVGTTQYTIGYVGLAIDFSASTGTGATAASNHNSTGAGGTYLGQDCLYSGAGLTNSSAIVSGDVARNAANAIINGVNSRLMTALSQTADTAAHMSYSSNGNGIGMAANKVIGGLSIWTNYTSSDFDNDQTFTRKSIDSNNYDGDSSAFSIGIDKQFGNIVAGVVGTSFDTDINVDANGGTYKADGETYGVYAGLNTGIIMIMAGVGTGSYDVDTERLDLGTGNTTITGSSEADIEYIHLAASAKLQRGRFVFMPRIAYRDLSLDTDAFTDVVPNDANIAGPSNDNTTGTDATGKNVADVQVAAFSANSTLTEIGINASIGAGVVTPFIDAAYVAEDTTQASYQTELTTDSLAETSATDADGYSILGAGISLNVSGRLTGILSYYETMDRDDYNETTLSATIKLSF
ncbi:MAG: autotransporter outer membrane beta-barrel domain-containing protein [Pseudomonadota bacterium]|nr:autotransporter outer membrane beta-barrel domain-containing protein [Pseudomonadota bacterium]